MPIFWVHGGDLVDNEYGAMGLAHGCNCLGVMGAGVARSIADRYPALYVAYRRRCVASPPTFQPGGCWVWTEDGFPYIFNLGTQQGIGRGEARLRWVARSLSRMRENADALGVTSIALPRLGSGLGGLPWDAVRAIMNVTLETWSGQVYVYEEYAPSPHARAGSVGTEKR